MIYVSQGHEAGIGLEVFLKAFICLPKSAQSHFKLFSSRIALTDTLKSLNLDFDLEKSLLKIGNSELNIVDIGHTENTPLTTTSLVKILEIIREDDILVTLPSSKDQIILPGETRATSGHTDFFRRFYNIPEITMNFLSPYYSVLLLSDHISTEEVKSYITSDLVVKKVSTTLNELSGLRPIKSVYFSGINPHCGEGGLISNHDSCISNAITILKRDFPTISFYGPFAGDTLHFKPIDLSALHVYALHDQGLAPFKLMNGLIGINLSLGLSFKRVSVDHGTAFELFGKNQAEYQGMLFLLNEVLKWI